MEEIKTFFESIDSEFWTYLESNAYEIGKKYDEYNSCLKEINELFEFHPNLEKVIDDEEIVELTKEDVKALIELKGLYYKKNFMDMKNIFFLGGQNLYYYLKKINVINKKSGE